jgi:hypothetical protein
VFRALCTPEPFATPLSAAVTAAQQQKQSINHVGKETNVLRYGQTSTSSSFLRGVSTAFAPGRLTIFAGATDAGMRYYPKPLM